VRRLMIKNGRSVSAEVADAYVIGADRVRLRSWHRPSPVLHCFGV